MDVVMELELVQKAIDASMKRFTEWNNNPNLLKAMALTGRGERTNEQQKKDLEDFKTHFKILCIALSNNESSPKEILRVASSYMNLNRNLGRLRLHFVDKFEIVRALRFECMGFQIDEVLHRPPTSAKGDQYGTRY